VSDIDTEEVDSLKVLDPKRPIREATELLHKQTSRAPAYSVVSHQTIKTSQTLRGRRAIVRNGLELVAPIGGTGGYTGDVGRDHQMVARPGA
jgi:hypothetical protein